MNINRNNYEIWFLDYYEGRLSPDKVKELMSFIELHYDLKDEFDNFENITLSPAKNLVFDAKESLKKSTITSVGNINEKNYQDYFIAETEGDLKKEQSEQLAVFIEKNHKLKKDFELFKKVKVTPDENIKFTAKENLKKRIVIPSGSINETNYAEYFVAAIEGDLDLPKHTELKDFLNKNPQLHKDYILFGQTKLRIDTAIAFNKKQQLKKKEAPVRTINTRSLYYSLSVAASVMLIIAIYFIIGKTQINKSYTANRNDIKVNRNVYENIKHPVIKNNANNIIYYTNLIQKKQENNLRNTSEFRDFMKASVLNPALIPQLKQEYQKELSTITINENVFAKAKENNIDEEKHNDNKFLSMKEFTMLGIKRTLTPKEKRDKVTPNYKLSIWDVADAGVHKFNTFTGAKVVIEHKDNNNYTFALGRKYEYSRSVER